MEIRSVVACNVLYVEEKGNITTDQGKVWGEMVS